MSVIFQRKYLKVYFQIHSISKKVRNDFKLLLLQMWKIYALIDFCNTFQVPGECVCVGGVIGRRKGIERMYMGERVLVTCFQLFATS